VSTFYLLPPRPFLAEHLAGLLQGVLPGLDWTASHRADLTAIVDRAAASHEDVYVVYREELPDDEDPARALTDGFGASPGDEVIEVRAGNRLGELSTRRWLVVSEEIASPATSH
jgi:hypothetical protein